MWRLILTLVLALIVAVFAIDNSLPVRVHFLAWSLPQVGLALVILLSALLGAVLGVTVGLWQLFRERRSHRLAMVTVSTPPPEPAAPPEPDSTAKGEPEPEEVPADPDAPLGHSSRMPPAGADTPPEGE